jgi:hypothetical protein
MSITILKFEGSDKAGRAVSVSSILDNGAGDLPCALAKPDCHEPRQSCHDSIILDNGAGDLPCALAKPDCHEPRQSCHDSIILDNGAGDLP